MPTDDEFVPEVIEVSTRRVSCDGLSKDAPDVLGHPKVYMDMGTEDFVDCKYCDRRFVLKG